VVRSRQWNRKFRMSENKESENLDALFERMDKFSKQFDYIKPFGKDIKIYYFKHRERLKMTVRVTDNFAMTYYWDKAEFDDMIENWQNEWVGKAKGVEMFIGPKNREGQRFVRISAAGRACHEHRVPFRAMIQLKKEYYHQLNNPMPWDKEE